MTAFAMQSDVSQMRFDLGHSAVFPWGEVVPLDENGSTLINFTSVDDPFPCYSFVDVLRGSVPPETFRHKTVLVGFTASGLRDLYPTPVSSGMPGIEVHAHIISSMLHGTLAQAADRRTVVGVTVLLGMLAAALAGGLRPLVGAAAILFLGVAFLVSAIRLFATATYLLPIMAPLVAMSAAFGVISVSRLTAEEAGRRRLRDEFRRYAPPEVVAQLDAGVLQQRLAGTLRPVSVLFADLRGFSELAATAGPTRTVALLNRYFEIMTAVTFDLEGTVDNIMGDGLLVTFNAMGDQHDHVSRAVHLAVNMVAELERLNEKWLVDGDLQEPLRIGIGLHTGEVVVGNVGSHIRTQYTVIGQVVNLAARLEKLNRKLGTTILSTGEVIASIGQQFEVRSMGQQEVNGHPDAVEVYEIIGWSNVGSLRPKPEASAMEE
ncbi:MAG: adenylate/guanylate cyclase domain-containing protein [Candidatus Zipacnadales bacterium]